MFAYTVRATFDDRDVARQWTDWLRDEHLRDVCDAGALDAEVIRIDPPADRPAGSSGVACEVRYHFADRAAFEQYEREHAPQLREEGMKRFPPERGIGYERSTGVVVCRRPSM